MSNENENAAVEVAKEKEYVHIDGKSYEALLIVTSNDSVSFTLQNMTVADAVEKFESATAVDVSGEDQQIYGAYRNVTFAAVAINEDKSITVAFKVPSDTERRISVLEKTQEEQDEVLAELLGGGESDE
nr:MAG TPA: hypothetical protein [Caudoviricetes sp.]